MHCTGALLGRGTNNGATPTFCLKRSLPAILKNSFRSCVDPIPWIARMRVSCQAGVRMRPLLRSLLPSFVLCVMAPVAFGQSQLANTTVLIVRHAEKPAEGTSLTPQGFARANAYAKYFAPFFLDGKPLEINALYAGQDSKGSVRPRLTLEPLSHALHLPLNTDFSTENPEALATSLKSSTHGNHVLIAWRHKKIPALITALGGDPAQLLAASAWPDDVYDWVVVLRYNETGNLEHEELIHEPRLVP